MSVTTVTLTGNITDLGLDPQDTVHLWIEPNSRQGLIDTANNRWMTGRGKIITVDDDGAWTITLVSTDSADIQPAENRQYRVRGRVPDGLPGRDSKGMALVDSGWFALSADSNFADRIEVDYLDPVWATAKTLEIQGYVDDAQGYAEQTEANINGLSIGTVTTGAPGTDADVTLSGTAPDREFNFTIPEGQQGLPGPGSAAWAPTTAVTIGAVRQAPDGSYIKSTANRTTRSSFDATEEGFWTAVLADPTTVDGKALFASFARANGKNVLNYGAVGDGSASDHAAFQNARDAAGVDGTVIVPAGRYVLNGLLLNKANQRWVLEADAVLTVANGVTQNVINIGANGITIQGPGELDGNRGGGANAAGIYDTLQGATDITIEGLTVRETLGYGIQLYGSRCAVRRSKFFNTKGAAVLYVSTGTTEASDGEITECYVDRSNEAANLTDAGLWIGSGNNAYPFRRAVIADNIVKMPRNPTNASASPICIELTTADGGTITGNVTDGGSMGISLGNAGRTTVSGNTVRGWNWWGIEVAGSKAENVVDGNVVDGDGIGGRGYAGGGGLSGIVTNDSVERTVISNNIVRGLASGLAGPIRGIQLQSTSRGELVAGNLLYVPEYGVSTGGDCTLIGNVIRKEGSTGSQGILVTTSGGLGPATNVSVVGGEIKGFTDGVKLEIVGGFAADNILIEAVRFVSCTNPYTTALSGGGTLGASIVRRNNLPLTANSAISETALATLGGGFLVDNNTAFRFKDSGGTSRRIGLVSGGNAIYYGDIDNAMNSDLLLLAGGTGVAKVLQAGVEVAHMKSAGIYAMTGDLFVVTAGKGLRIKEGANARSGVSTLVGGTVTVANTSVTANTRIQLTVQSLGTVTTPKAIAVTARVNGTSFTITSADATDTSVVAWQLVEGF
ncbi:right-handed parallel beta-helix repeat-containing protein [Nocardioides sp. PD653]|uniref:right-handed parallel beta-helix repeat-containing protein n=1 Tax=Nocardioides sp. PD653 TaxID=393303 RepID=UPI0009EF99F9|nr:right-handed parallel beta-helix repeat-containing protein [Nocardioides sp. PD653]GAW54761.1 hypothetical protein PD653_2175 [Nocardioides sp. PD653]